MATLNEYEKLTVKERINRKFSEDFKRKKVILKRKKVTKKKKRILCG